LNALYNETIAELEHSKAKLVATITAQLKANYAKQVENLEAKVKQLEELVG
jgi:exodeoxyribonuclease VII large subunit